FPRSIVRLYYYKSARGNFGDDLNLWIWPRLFPDLLDEDESELFVGIGSLLNHRLPPRLVKHIFGSGYGYGRPPDLSDGFIVHAVRGLETARLLGLSPSLAMSDPAVLVRATSFATAPGKEFGF